MSVYQEIKVHVDFEALKAALDQQGIPYEFTAVGELLPYYSYGGGYIRGRADLVIRQQHMDTISRYVGDTGVKVDRVTGKVTVDADLAHGNSRERWNAVMREHSRIIVERAAQQAGYRLSQVATEGRTLRLQARPTRAAQQRQSQRVVTRR